MTLKTNDENVKSALKSAKERTEQELFSIQIVGRALTKDEINRSKKLKKCLTYINEAIFMIENNRNEAS